jgi:hypothetical protein
MAGWSIRGQWSLNMRTHLASKKYKNVEGMNTRKLLLTGLAVFSISLGAMAQERHDKPDNRTENRQPERFVKEVPKGGREVVYKDVHYHYAEGKFYRPQKEGFERVQPPVGLEVNNLPPGYAVKKHKGVTYYYKDDVCFKKGLKKNTYVIVKRPW